MTRLHTLAREVGTVADITVESTASLPGFDLGPTGDNFRKEVRAFLAEQPSPERAER